jgi:hypothetical protein
MIRTVYIHCVRGTASSRFVSYYISSLVFYRMAEYSTLKCTKRLLGGDKDATSSTSETAPPANPKLLDELATERLLAAYSGGKVDKSSRAVLLKWLEDQ